MVKKKRAISKNEKLVPEKHLFYVTVTAVISVIAILLVILIMSKYSATTIVDEQGNLVGQARAFRTTIPTPTISSTSSVNLVKRSQTYILSQGQSCVSLAAQVADINSRLLQPKLEQLSQAYDNIGKIKSSSAYLNLVSSKASLNGDIEALTDLRNDIYIRCQHMGILQGSATQTTAQAACWNVHEKEYIQLGTEIADKRILVADIEKRMGALLDDTYQLLNNIQIEVNQYASNIETLNLNREELGCDVTRG